MKLEKPKKTSSRPLPKAVKSTTTAKSSTTRKTVQVKKKALEVPPILLEGDSSAPSGPSGPGRRYALGPGAPPAAPQSSTVSELPEAYGTKKLLLTARDPHWLYAHWDMTREQLQHYNALSADRHLILRVYLNAVHGSPVTVIHVHPESRNWFVHVDRGGAKYMAELGYHDAGGKWIAIARSSQTLTPPDSMSEDTSVRFASIPTDIPFSYLLEIIKQVAGEHPSLAEALMQLREEGHPGLPETISLTSGGTWTPEQEKALLAVVNMDSVRRVWIGSLEVTELVRRQMVRELSSAAAGQFSWPTSPGGVSSVSSPFGGREQLKGFWFNVNAELIIYGATEPDAVVTIGGKPIKLRTDGSFSFRFALPDGNFDLPAVAVSSDGDDQRAAALKFSRHTEFKGEVGHHPQDSRLKIPSPANVS